MTAVAASAPGRVNLIGEHTDYNGGLVLPAPLALRVEVVVAPAAALEVTGAHADTRSSELARAVCAELGVADDMRVQSSGDLPSGAGLASSAAFEVALARALRSMYDLRLDERELALACQRAENRIVPCGVMDQLCCALAPEHGALMIDCATLATTEVALPASVEFAVFDSQVRHDNAAGGYAQRRAECEEAARLLGVELLARDLPDGSAEIESLPPPLPQRVLHVLYESAAVRAVVDAFDAGNVDGAALFLRGSHVSQRERFEVSTPEVDALVERAEAAGALAARLTGGGFGGAVLAMCNAGEAAAVAEQANAPLVAVVS
ncbi:MAG: galactokinase [Thermoleophilaceae bacterium]|jgi:galactokinase|nr:galactokinase [Thermoleophilaceae bacterium]